MITRGSVRRKSKRIFQKVVTLRKKGHSYSEIRKKTGIAKSTINNWLTFAGLTLSKEHLEISRKKYIENNIIATKASKITRSKRRSEDINKFIQKYKTNLNDPLFIVGVMLYEAEGSKGEDNNFSNSDYRLIVVFMKFLETYFNINRKDNMTYRLYIHEIRKNDSNKIINFWSKKLLIDREKIKISWKHNLVSKKRQNLNYVGQLGLRVNGISHFAGKLLAISDIILTRYQRL